MPKLFAVKGKVASAAAAAVAMCQRAAYQPLYSGEQS